MKIYILISLFASLCPAKKDLVVAPEVHYAITANDLLGKWALSSVSLKITDMNGLVIQDLPDQPAAGQLIMQFDFKEDNKVGYYGNILADGGNGEPYRDTGTYEVKDSKITININNEPLTFNLIFNTSTDLYLETEDVMDYSGTKANKKTVYKFIRVTE